MLYEILTDGQARDNRDVVPQNEAENNRDGTYNQRGSFKETDICTFIEQKTIEISGLDKKTVMENLTEDIMKATSINEMQCNQPHDFLLIDGRIENGRNCKMTNLS